MKLLTLTTLLLVLCGCSSKKDRFRHDMQERYEVQCNELYSIYASDRERAKKALEDVIELSLTERNKAKFYWRFNLIIADSKARLAVMAEEEGREQDAQRLFATASEYMALQKTMLREHLHEMPHVVFAESDTNAAITPTRDQWRKAIAALDAAYHVQWKSPNRK